MFPSGFLSLWALYFNVLHTHVKYTIFPWLIPLGYILLFSYLNPTVLYLNNATVHVVLFEGALLFLCIQAVIYVIGFLFFDNTAIVPRTTLLFTASDNSVTR